MSTRSAAKKSPEKTKSLESWIWDAACTIRGAKGRAGVFLDTGTASRATGNARTSKEMTACQWFVDRSLSKLSL